ncbi:MAG: Na+/H+ antiporter subunit G [Candidatus Parabeggiatoa sp. nov. 2]|nr:MAG: Na+/H+ antiporter subunit G [Beggiatoa sp. 4572_84]RKZ63622.1 MAG: Na+/H+ antiporter subunit G [Gammaproteobacteria bacterium]
MAIFGNILIVIGAAFLFLGALGLVRMPDVYNRIQAGTKAVTLGSLALLAGVAFIHPAWLPKLLVIALFILFTSPVGSSIIARAAYLAGLQPFTLSSKEKARYLSKPEET